MRSDCCGYETNDTDLGLCPECLEHCEFEDDEDDGEFNPGLESVLTMEQKAIAFNYLSGALHVINNEQVIKAFNASMVYAVNQLKGER